MTIELATTSLPDFGTPSSEPRLSRDIFDNRVRLVRQKMTREKLDFVVVYGDREHNANTTFLCGYDPRFEESILIVGNDRAPALLVGNEGWGYAELAPLPLRRILFQSLSLLGQDRTKGRRLEDILRDERIHRSAHVGVAGWKYFSNTEFADADHTFEVPSYLVDTLRGMAGEVKNVNAIFMNPVDGLRIVNEADQLAAFEFASCYTSNGLKNVMFNLRPGISELEAATLMRLPGLPHSAHTMLSSGPRAAFGLPSPGDHKLETGEPFTMALGLWGALNARAGWLAKDQQDLPPSVRDYVDKLAIPYFRAIVKWYEHIGIGVKGGELYDIIHDEIGDPFFGVSLNPGHYIHIDEWVHSPVFKNSDIKLQSGNAIQVDVIPATGSGYYTINIEDGIALADPALRKEIETKYPEMWARVQGRRKFMKDILGINLKPEVLPFSNIPAYLPPFLLSPEKVLAVKAR